MEGSAEVTSSLSIEQQIIKLIVDQEPSKLKRLLKANPEYVNRPLDERGWTPIFYVVNANSLKMAAPLLMDFKTKVNVRDNRGYTPLMVCVETWGEQGYNVAQYLCDQCANIEAKSLDNLTVISFVEGLNLLRSMLNHYRLKGPYAKMNWHKYKGLFWLKKFHPFDKLKGTLIKEVTKYIA